MVVRVHSDSAAYRNRLLLTEYSRAGVTLFLGIIPESVIALLIPFKLPLAQLYFLKAENIGIRLVKKVHKSLFNTGAEPVYVPRYKLTFHLYSPNLILRDSSHGIALQRAYIKSAKI